MISRRLEMGMADHAEIEYASATGNDYPAHEQTYRNFVTLVKAGIAVVAAILIVMAYFLT
jgi:Bacterial aa3 type cytochrome c oxidase subunit IV